MALDAPISQGMTAPVASLDGQASVSDAMLLMAERTIRHVPVTREGELVVALVTVKAARRGLAESFPEVHVWRVRNGKAVALKPQARHFWQPPQETSESALKTRWNGQLYAVLGERAEDGRWQLRLWWKPFVTMIWYGGVLISLGGLLALLGRVASDVRRLVARDKIAWRRSRQGR